MLLYLFYFAILFNLSSSQDQCGIRCQNFGPARKYCGSDQNCPKKSAIYKCNNFGAEPVLEEDCGVGMLCIPGGPLTDASCARVPVAGDTGICTLPCGIFSGIRCGSLFRCNPSNALYKCDGVATRPVFQENCVGKETCRLRLLGGHVCSDEVLGFFGNIIGNVNAVDVDDNQV